MCGFQNYEKKYEIVENLCVCVCVFVDFGMSHQSDRYFFKMFEQDRPNRKRIIELLKLEYDFDYANDRYSQCLYG